MSYGLKITIEANLSQVNFLDVSFDLNSNKFFPFRKPNDSPLYIHANSNHPPSIIKQLPSMIGNRLSSLSCNENEFKSALPPYVDALKKSNYSLPNNTLPFVTPTKNKRSRKRNIIWFNPPYNSAVKTNIGKKFLQLLKTHFPIHHRLHKIFNNNNIKLSYSCMPNIENIISNHNKTILNSTDPQTSTPPCNCRNKNKCPLNGKCRESSIVYKASIFTETNPKKYYYGLCETEFKTRFNNHIHTFKSEQKRNATELSKEVWRIKEEGKIPSIEWQIVKKAKPYKCGDRKCNLCLEEKLFILLSDNRTSLNKRNELIAKCRHKTKFKLRNFSS